MLENMNKALHESEEKYRNLVERANDGIAIIQDSVFKYVNPWLAEIGDFFVEGLIGTAFTDYIHPDEIPKVVNYYKKRMAGEDVKPIYETVIQGRDNLIFVEGHIAEKEMKAITWYSLFYVFFFFIEK